MTVRDFERAQADAVVAREHGADLVEFRVDECFTGDARAIDAEIARLAALVADAPLPVLVTCRIAAEGGAYEGTDQARARMIRCLLDAPQPPRYVDIELSAFERSGELRALFPSEQTGLVLSTHDHEGVPADLARRLTRLARQGAIGKIACRCRSLHDALTVLELPGLAGGVMIAQGMGEFGLLSRVLAPKFGSLLSFASLRDASVTAPGQPTLRTLLEEYRFRSIHRTTKVFGILGWPVQKSRSPRVHNALFARHGLDGVYAPMPVAEYPEDQAASDAAFRAALLELIEHPQLDFSGGSVTMPHKARLGALASAKGWRTDECSRITGCANTLVVRPDREVSVSNTDALGVAGCLEKNRSVAGSRAVVVGAGGMGAAAAYALLHAGAEVVLCNRTLDRAEQLARKLRRAFPSRQIEARTLGSASGTAFDIVVQGTSAGMGESRENPLADVVLSPGTIVLEAVAHPAQTPALRLARERGAAVIDGVSLFARQAAEQFRLWAAEIFALRGLPEAAGLARDIEGVIRGENTPGAGGEGETRPA